VRFFAGGVGKDEVTDFAAGGGVILADVLGYPEGKLAVESHEAEDVALPEEADLAGLLSLGGSFIGASGNGSGNSQGTTDFDYAENESAAVTAADGELHTAAADDEHAARNLTFRK
jgi:hypothetical protein